MTATQRQLQRLVLRARAAGIGVAGAAAVLVCLTLTSGGTAAAPAAPAAGKAATAARDKPGELTGQVTHVVDGDSLYLQTGAGTAPLEIRLAGIDAPEGCQPGGADAKTALAGFVLGKTVSATIEGHDVYGRTLAHIAAGEVDVNKRMVVEGQAWSIRTKWDRGPYVAQEKVARALLRGVHASGESITPADFRRRNGPCKAPDGEQVAAASPVAATTVNSSDATAPRPVADAVRGRAGGGSVVTSTSSSIGSGNTLTIAGTAAARCDGRKHCSQMKSCEEATWFLQHCPGVEMDGDRDGVPCERQWCGR
jgi:endonuclease YncB( thermonuclease family)